jgi:hypothetical protein
MTFRNVFEALFYDISSKNDKFYTLNKRYTLYRDSAAP